MKSFCVDLVRFLPTVSESYSTSFAIVGTLQRSLSKRRFAFCSSDDQRVIIARRPARKQLLVKQFLTLRHLVVAGLFRPIQRMPLQLHRTLTYVLFLINFYH